MITSKYSPNLSHVDDRVFNKSAIKVMRLNSYRLIVVVRKPVNILQKQSPTHKNA